MKNILTGSVFIFFISLAFCDEDEKYSFISKLFKEENIGKEIKYHSDRKLSFTIPSIGYVKYVSSFNESIKYVGKKGKFHIIESTLTEMKTENVLSRRLRPTAKNDDIDLSENRTAGGLVPRNKSRSLQKTKGGSG